MRFLLRDQLVGAVAYSRSDNLVWFLKKPEVCCKLTTTDEITAQFSIHRNIICNDTIKLQTIEKAWFQNGGKLLFSFMKATLSANRSDRTQYVSFS